MKRTAALLVFIALFVAPAPRASAQGPAPASTPFRVQDYRLRNGLRVVLSEDARLPLVTVAVAYGAGTLREKPGQEGLAYLLENLMFQGSENVPSLQHVGFVQKVGGELNATTTVDKALFYETLPANYLALVLWLESDRMRSLAMAPAAIERTRADLLEAHRSRLASDPFFGTFAAFDSLLFPDDLYGRPLLGTGEDLMKLPEPEIAAFRRAYYVPNNAVLAIVGDIDAGRARELVARYFETVPPGADVPTPPRPVFDRPNDAVVRTARIATDGAGFHMGYRFFPFQPGEIYALRILEYLLAEGETSRLRDRLVHKDRLARHFSVSVDSRLSIAALKFFCLGNNRVMAERSQRAILSELDKLRTNAVSLDEINRAKRRFKRDYLDRLSTNLGKALFLVDAVFAGAPLDDLGAEMERYLAVGPPSVQAFVAKYFIPQNRVVLDLEGR
ncbi:MAG: insulinase family protein [Acidobacteria bacterium]|nr:insulinase family protein [Acidobacteriota bacterium]